ILLCSFFLIILIRFWIRYPIFNRLWDIPPKLKQEEVWKQEKKILSRPNKDDKKDYARLNQTALEQVYANVTFREIFDFLGNILYLHLVPQLLRGSNTYTPLKKIKMDAYGSDFISWLVKTPQWKRESQLKRIEDILKLAVPQLEGLKLVTDKDGVTHLFWKEKGWNKYSNVNENQLSDGTIRLLGILWGLTSTGGPLVFEEPELSLHPGFVKKLVPLMYRIQSLKKSRRRQIILSTHSSDLLSDEGIDGCEVLLLYPSIEGTRVQIATENEEIKALLEADMTPAETVIQHTKPEGLEKLNLLK
ncbi:AAA family ATPase, partial [candidate division WOR-3 bacterium]|nr:AAA family ATPase [candidate division WOR-3 bacterium]